MALRYGPYALAAYTCFGLGAYSSTRTSLSELVPWIPISICISSLLTVFFPPKVQELLASPSDNEIRMEEGRMFGDPRSPVQPGSVQSDGDIQNRQQTHFTRNWLQDYEHDLAFLGGRPASRYSSRSLHDSTIVLEDFSDEDDHMVRSAQADNHAEAHSQALTEPMDQNGMECEPRNYPRSTSPDSMSEVPEGRPLL